MRTENIAGFDISVVIPLYNKDYSVERCLASILNQTTLPSEVIIVNDGSTDDSLEKVNKVIESVRGNYPLFILKDQSNQGVSAARNNGISLASSDYIALLDADDEWYPGFIEKMLEIIDLHPARPIYTCVHEIRSDGGCYTPPQKFSATNQSVGLIHEYFKHASHSALVNSSKVVLYKPAFNAVGGFPVGETLCEDLYLWSRLCERGEFVFSRYLGVCVNQLYDVSRESRVYARPYILEYYSHRPQTMSGDLRKYLWTVYKNHLRLSILNGNRKEFFLRWKVGPCLFGLKSYLLLTYLCIPSFLMKFAKRLRRKLLGLKR
jgi:glycosyltransferase involved in cell wall biosynthesis